MNRPVTIRYANRLLLTGGNDEFTIISLKRAFQLIDEIQVGFYYTVDIWMKHGQQRSAVGVTPRQAVERCLVKHGITFR